MAVTVFRRRELKYMLTRAQYAELYERLGAYMEPDPYCINGSAYSIYNVYLDTPDNRIIIDSTAKPYFKEKLRLRSYIERPGMEDTIFIELKRKIGGTVSKRRAPITLGQCYDFLASRTRPERIDIHTAQVLDEIEYYLTKYPASPALYLSYSRVALFGRDDPEFRVTFDTEITTRREQPCLELGSYGSQLLAPDQVLMEVKINGSHPLWFAGLLSQLKIYPSSFSKYGTEYKNNKLSGKEITHVV